MNARLITSATLLALSLLSSGAVMAAGAAAVQANTTGTLVQPTALQGQRSVQAMFAFADQNQDGQLTRAEAKGRLPLTYGSFDRIDTARRGWISFTQFIDFTNQRVGQQAEELLKIGQWR